MPGLNNIEQLRNIGGQDFARSYLWDVYFSGPLVPPEPFTTWFPAETCSEPAYNVSERNFELGITEHYLPYRFHSKNLEFSCYDSENHSLELWMNDWVEKVMFNNRLGVGYLDEIVSNITICRLSPQRKIIRTRMYTVYPYNRLEVSWDSQSNAKKMQLSFRVVYDKEAVRVGPSMGSTSELPSGTGIVDYLDTK